MITADTITDEQIRELRDEYAGTGLGDKYHHAMIALGKRKASPGHTRHESRARCAEILNARAVSPTAVTCGYEPCDGGPCEHPKEHAAREARHHARERAASKAGAK